MESQYSLHSISMTCIYESLLSKESSSSDSTEKRHPSGQAVPYVSLSVCDMLAPGLRKLLYFVRIQLVYISSFLFYASLSRSTTSNLTYLKIQYLLDLNVFTKIQKFSQIPNYSLLPCDVWPERMSDDNCLVVIGKACTHFCCLKMDTKSRTK